MAITSKTWHLKKHFVGMPTDDDFFIEEKKIQPLTDGEFLMEVLYLSVDPYMRIYTHAMTEGAPMIGAGVGRVIQSKTPDFPVGTLVVGPCGWTTHYVPKKEELKTFMKVPPSDYISYAIGALGMPGITAYFGLLDACQPKAGETLFVNSAAGPVGSMVGQIAKIKGCTVVGCAGSELKLNYLKELGFDGVINYKTESVNLKLKELCPNGVDCFFDNVGGEMFDTVLSQMNRYGRVALCGAISGYNTLSIPKGPYVHMHVIGKELNIKGFVAQSFYPKADVAIKELQQWIAEGKVKVREHAYNGFDKMLEAFLSLFTGEHVGKVVVKVKMD